jgi:hypothetical protein
MKYVAECHVGTRCGWYRGRTVKSKPQVRFTINGRECGTSVRWYSRIYARTSTHFGLRAAAGAMTAARTLAQWGQRAIARSIEYSMTAFQMQEDGTLEDLAWCITVSDAHEWMKHNADEQERITGMDSGSTKGLGMTEQHGARWHWATP